MKFVRPFSLPETKLMDSQWEFEHPGGSFTIEFRADSFNSFVCDSFPDLSFRTTWRLEDAESGLDMRVHINWGKFGEYELKMSPDGESMTGSAKGRPSEWRKAKRLRGIGMMPTPTTTPSQSIDTPMKKRGREGCGGCKKGCGECGRENE